jgi:hypothetical protein
MTNNKKDNSMAKRLISMMAIASIWALTGCNNAADSVDATDQTPEAAATVAKLPLV